MSWEWPGSVVVHYVDGDTLDALLRRDIGFHGEVKFIQRLRLSRINTAPRGTELGDTALLRLSALTAGVQLLITTLKPYKYGDEWMAEIQLPDGRSVSEVLVSEGLAAWWDGRGPRPMGESVDG